MYYVDEEQGDFITLILFKTCAVGNKLPMYTYVGEHEGITYALKYLAHPVDSNGVHWSPALLNYLTHPGKINISELSVFRHL
jgi:hypothetical protein